MILNAQKILIFSKDSKCLQISENTTFCFKFKLGRLHRPNTLILLTIMKSKRCVVASTNSAKNKIHTKNYKKGFFSWEGNNEHQKHICFCEHLMTGPNGNS